MMLMPALHVLPGCCRMLLVLLLISTAVVADSPVLAVTQHLRLSFEHRVSHNFCSTGFVCIDCFDGHQLSIVCACSK
jgi:hypothetical protein